MRNVKFIEVQSELGAGTRGASLGPGALRVAAWNRQSNLFNRIPIVEIENENKCLFQDAWSPHARYIRGILTLYEKMMPVVGQTVKDGTFPILLSGDHSVAGGTIAGIKTAFPNSKLGVIWVDAHADIHSPYTTPSGNLHGMTLSISLAEDNMRDKVNSLDVETASLWDNLKKVGGISPKVSYPNLVYIGLRDVEFGEMDLLQRNEVKIVTTTELKREGVEKVSQDVLYYLKDCDLIYISFDVDSMDSSLIKGTGVPVAHGLTEKEAGNLLKRLVQHEKVCCLEISEINPTLDNENKTAEITFDILEKVITQIQS